jgi:hypothetical protein
MFGETKSTRTMVESYPEIWQCARSVVTASDPRTFCFDPSLNPTLARATACMTAASLRTRTAGALPLLLLPWPLWGTLPAGSPRAPSSGSCGTSPSKKKKKWKKKKKEERRKKKEERRKKVESRKKEEERSKKKKRSQEEKVDDE